MHWDQERLSLVERRDGSVAERRTGLTLGLCRAGMCPFSGHIA